MVVGLSVLMVVLLAATVQADDEKEKKISVSECPKAVQKTLKQEAGKGKIVDVDVRKIKGVAIYESEVWLGDLEYDIVIRGDGTLLKKLLEDDGKDEGSDEADDDDEGDEKNGDDESNEDEDETETPIRMADLPKPVLRTLKREARGGEIEEIVKETEDGKVVYEAEVEFEGKDGEKEYEIEIAADGTLLSKVLEEQEGDEDEDDDEDE
jgi:hypothetical protein